MVLSSSTINNLNSNYKYFIVHDQSERILTILKTSIKFQGSQCEGDRGVFVWNPLVLSLKNMSKFDSKERTERNRKTERTPTGPLYEAFFLILLCCQSLD